MSHKCPNCNNLRTYIGGVYICLECGYSNGTLKIAGINGKDISMNIQSQPGTYNVQKASLGGKDGE